MKKVIFAFIISTALVFSTLNNTFALEEGYSEGEIDQILHLTNGPEITKLENIKINSYNFSSENFKNMQSAMLSYDKKLKYGIIQKYKTGEFSYTKMSGIVTEYEYLGYNLNKYLEWNRKIEKYPYLKKDTNVLKLIDDSYSQLRTHINRLKYLVFEERN
ncbi:MAG: hypothetical protein PHG82_01785 [Candidatus Gracilibacteria bacterium]|nr:hypothetical protein [Candidatus Gracilibacteria bacterium]